ncbi:hypothetical protein ACK8HX_08310 [Oryzobacter sp. R7]|uniref:hypothetical protein n=1 Tax=Oryzobacter faecalis TaxID=3388656 RepID=UPI00398D0777
MTAPGRARPAVLVAVLALTVGPSACGSPAPDVPDHRDAVVTAVEAALGDSRTALLAVDAWRDGDATTAYAAVVLRESATAVEGASSELTGLTPPPGGEDLRSRAEDALSDAGDAVVAARVAVERDDRHGAADASAAVAEASAALERLAEGLR